jgi:hypothetical protein
MPHMPVPVAATPMGPCCSACGVLPPVFTCGFCWGQQLLVLPGMAPPAAMPGTQQAYAPVIHAQQNASDSTLKSGFSKLGESFGSELGKAAAQAIFGRQY